LYQALPSLAALTDAAIKLKPLASHFQPLLPSPLDNDAAALLQYTVNLLESRAVELRATTQPMEAQLALAKLLDDAEGAVRMLEPEVKRISRTSLGSDRRPEATAFILTFDELAKATAATKEQFGPHDPSLASR
jgi:hypothetical protein